MFLVSNLIANIIRVKGAESTLSVCLRDYSLLKVFKFLKITIHIVYFHFPTSVHFLYFLVELIEFLILLITAI